MHDDTPLEERTDDMRDLTRKLAREREPEAPGTGTLPTEPAAGGPCQTDDQHPQPPAASTDRAFHQPSPEAARLADERRASRGDDS